MKADRPADAPSSAGWTRFVAPALALVLAACSPPEQRHAALRREFVFEQLGAVLAAEAPGESVLLVGNPFARRPDADASLGEAEAAARRGLERGLAGKSKLLEATAPELQTGAGEDPRSFPVPTGASTPLSFLTAPGAWDRLVTAHPDTRVLVSVIGLPADLATTRAWTESAGPRWALYLPDLRLLGPPTAVKAAFEERRLLAIVLARPGAPPESEPLADDRRADFERRYLLITRTNVDEALRRWPDLFP